MSLKYEPASEPQDHWGEVVQFILRDHLFTVLAIGACVGLVPPHPTQAPSGGYRGTSPIRNSAPLGP